MRTTECPMRSPVCFFLVALACASLGIRALAQQPLPPAEYSGEIVSNFGHAERHVGAVPFSLAVDWVGQWGDSDYSMQATTETSGGLRPTAAVQAEASSGDNLQFNIRSISMINYFVRVRPRGTPPPGTYTIPALIDARGQAQGTATAFVRINNGFPIQVETINGLQTFNVTVPVDIDPSNPDLNLVYVQLYAYARGYYLHPTYAASSQAYADPLFTFDQAAFDLAQGPNTFPLAEQFEFEYSEYLLNPPGPPTIITHPNNQTLCEGGAAMFTAAATSTAPMTYQWRLNGGDLLDGNGFFGTTTPALTIDPAMVYWSGLYDCLITNIAGSVATNPALLTVSLVGPADFNGDSVVDFFDYLDFVDAFSAQLPAADFNNDSVIDFFDYLDFVDAFSAGC